MPSRDLPCNLKGSYWLDYIYTGLRMCTCALRKLLTCKFLYYLYYIWYQRLKINRGKYFYKQWHEWRGASRSMWRIFLSPPHPDRGFEKITQIWSSTQKWAITWVGRFWPFSSISGVTARGFKIITQIRYLPPLKKWKSPQNHPSGMRLCQKTIVMVIPSNLMPTQNGLSQKKMA